MLRHRFRAAAKALLLGTSRLRRTPIPRITSKDAAEFRRFFPRSKFFILGHARSGTTLLMRLLRLHPEVHCDYQAHFFTRPPLLKSLVDTPEAEEWLRRKSNRWNRGQDLSPIVMRAAAEFVMERDAARLGKRIVGDKSPSSTIHGQAVRDLYDVFPDARVVYIVRDGRDVLISERFRNFVEESKFLQRRDQRILESLRAEPQSFGAEKRSIFSESALVRMTSGWAENLGEVDAEARRLCGRRYLALRYEDLLDYPDRELQRVWRFLRAKSIAGSLSRKIEAELKSNPDEEWQSRRGGRLAKFLTKGKAGNWRSLLTPRDREIFKKIAGNALIAWKYEKGFDW
jgi:hypothetical protein